jgi:hypothetical protein
MMYGRLYEQSLTVFLIIQSGCRLWEIGNERKESLHSTAQMLYTMKGSSVSHPMTGIQENNLSRRL